MKVARSFFTEFTTSQLRSLTVSTAEAIIMADAPRSGCAEPSLISHPPRENSVSLLNTPPCLGTDQPAPHPSTAAPQSRSSPAAPSRGASSSSWSLCNALQTQTTSTVRYSRDSSPPELFSSMRCLPRQPFQGGLRSRGSLCLFSSPEPTAALGFSFSWQAASRAAPPPPPPRDADLAQNKLLEDPQFIKYIEYLQYWRV